MIELCIFNKSNDVSRFDIFKKFFECINSEISLTCCTETDAVYQNVTVRGEWQIWHSGWFRLMMICIHRNEWQMPETAAGFDFGARI